LKICAFFKYFKRKNIIKKNNKKIINLTQYLNFFNISGFLGIGDWGLGIGDWGLGPIPNPQSPIPNPQQHTSLFRKH
jgi:hypothetical protein